MSFNNPATTIDGSDVTGTITGNTIQTDDTPPRIALNDPAYPNELIMESGQADETAPGRLLSQVTGLGFEAGTYLKSPTLDGGSAGLSLKANALAVGGGTEFQVDADEIVLNTFGAGAAVAVRETEIELNRPVMNADLTDASNTFPDTGRVFSVAYAGNTDANGFLTVAHGQAFTPAGAWAITGNPNASFAHVWGIDSIGATNVRIRFTSVSAFGALASTAVAGRLFLLAP